MNCDSTTNSASASGPEFEPQCLKFRVRDVSLNGQNSVRGFSIATLAAALAACGGGGSGGPSAPPPPPPPPANTPPTATDATGTAVEDGDPATGDAVGADDDGDSLTYSVTADGTYGSLAVADDGAWTYTPDNENETVNALAVGQELTDTATIEVSDGTDKATATVTITIQGANDNPTGEDGAGAVTAGSDDPATGSVNPADVDDGDTHTFAVGTQARHGTLTVDEAGNWSYALNQTDKDVMALDAGDTVDDTGTIVITDNNGGSVEVNVTVTITGINDAPMPSSHAMQDGTPVLLTVERDSKGKRKEGDAGTKMYSKFEVVAGTDGIEVELDLEAMFVDPEKRNVTYSLEDAPAWLSLESVNQDGETRWMLKGTPPLTGTQDLNKSVKLVAMDEVGGKGVIAFNVIWDDGNDEPYNLIVRDADKVETYITDKPVSENVKGVGTGLFVEVTDDDNPDHRFGTITWTVDNKMFEVDEATHEIKLKDGEHLDYEKLGTVNYSVNLTVTATDGGKKSVDQNVTVTVKNANDDPMKGEMPGNWWVTVDDSIDKDDVTKGQWLSFFIEEPDDEKPLFKDEDGEADLKYSLKSSPAWLTINADTGKIENKAKMLPTRGVHSVTVVATDEKGKGTSVEQTFKLAVAFSSAGDDDNDDPKIVSERGEDVAENSKDGVRLATFTVEDDDLDLADGGHPYAPEMPMVTIAEPSKDNSAGTVWTAPQIAARLKIKKLSGDNDSQSYEIVAMKTNTWLDYETLDELNITISVTDGINAPVIDSVKVDITDVNEAPKFDAVANTSTGDGVIAAREQQDDAKATIWLNLTKLFVDAEDGANQRDELTFSKLADLPDWMKALHSTGNLTTTWEDVKDAAGEPNANNDWGGGNTPPEDDDFVLILEVDRTAATGKDGQDSVGKDAFSVTVADSKGKTYTHKFNFEVTDENTDAEGANGSGVGFASDVREGHRVNVTFKEAVDPDFDGADNKPVAVLYQILSGTDIVQVSDSTKPYEVKQSDVESTLTGKVVYFQLDGASIVSSPLSTLPTQLSKESTTVTNAEDRGSATFVFETTSTVDQFAVTATVTDEDVGDADSNYEVQSSALAYQWQWSENGGGNWQDFDEASGGKTSTVTIGADQSGKFIRVEVTYDGAHGTTVRNETIRSEGFKVGKVGEIEDEDIAAPTASALVGTNAAIGATLEVPATVNKNAGTEIQWLANDVPIEGATGRTFTVTQAQAGLAIKVSVKEKDKDGGLTSVNTSSAITVEGQQPGNTAPSGKPVVYDLDAAAPAKAGDLVEMHRGPIDFTKIFSDFNGDKLSYSLGDVTVGAATSPLASTDIGSDLDVYLSGADATNGNTLMIIDPATGEVSIYTTQTGSHDGNPADGGGNIINLPYTATDPAGGDSGAVNVGLRIDVKATGVTSTDAVAGTVSGFGFDANIQENATATDTININITDENKVDHAFGKYDWAKATVTDKMSLFEVKAVKADGSQATLQLKKGAKLENVDEETDYKVTIEVSPMGLFKDDKVKITVTLKIQNTDSSTDTTPSPTPNDVPGLKDDDGDGDNDIEDGDDTDDDGGTNPPPMDPMSAMISMLDDGIF